MFITSGYLEVACASRQVKSCSLKNCVIAIYWTYLTICLLLTQSYETLENSQAHESFVSGLFRIKHI